MGPDMEDNITLLSTLKRKQEGKSASWGREKMAKKKLERKLENKAVSNKRGRREKWRETGREKELHILLWEILEMDQSAYLKLAPCVIVHSSVGLPPSQFPGLFVFTKQEGPQASGRA